MQWQQHRWQTPRLPGNKWTGGHCFFVHWWSLTSPHTAQTRSAHRLFILRLQVDFHRQMLSLKQSDVDDNRALADGSLRTLLLNMHSYHSLINTRLAKILEPPTPLSYTGVMNHNSSIYLFCPTENEIHRVAIISQTPPHAWHTN